MISRRRMRVPVAAVLGLAMLIVATVAPATAAPKGPPNVPPQSSFMVTVCADGDDLRISVSWSRLSADGVSFGWGDSAGGLGVMEPLAGVTRAGSVTHTFVGAAQHATVAGAGLHLKQAVMASAELNSWTSCAN